MGSYLPMEQKEKVRHGEVTFPVQRYVTTLTQEAPMVTTHWHEEAEFTLIEEGNCAYHIQLEKHNAQAGDLLFIPPMRIHSITRQSERMCSNTYVFHMNFLGTGAGDICTLRYLGPIAKQELVPPFLLKQTHPAYPEARHLFDTLDTAWEKQTPGFELEIKASLLSLVALLLPYCEEEAKLSQLQTEHAQKIRTALEFIEEHCAENLSISEIAAACYFSEYHFMRFFKKYVGMTCVDYIKNRRLEKAVELFEQGERSILDVSLAVGFRSLSYFYREFRAKYGMTPKQLMEAVSGRENQ